MHRKPYRFGLLIIGLLVTAAVGYRALQDEASLGRAYREGVAHDRAAGQALESLLNLKASLHAYVAPGQDLPAWSRQAEASIAALREQLVALDTAAPAPAEADTRKPIDQLAIAERRARDYARRGELLLAGEVIFSESREAMGAATAQVESARTRLASIHESRTASIRREQAILAAAAVLGWLVIAVLLVPPVTEAAAKDPNEWLNDLAATIKKPIPKGPEPARKPEAEPAPEPVERVEPARVEPVLPALSLEAIQRVGEVCSDLSALADVGALTGALGRAAAAIEASGMIVWVASNDANSLSPVASHGFDEKLVARIGRIARDSANLTAAAFRGNVPRVSAATATAPAALAVALCGPTGPVGVLSVELKPGVPADEARVALATIFAAQLATLAQPIPSSPAQQDSGQAPGAATEADTPAVPERIAL